MGHEIRSTNLVEKLTPNQQLVISNQTPPLLYRADFVFEAEGNGTKLTCNLDIKGGSSIVHLAKPVLEYIAQTRLEADFNTLKTLVENQSALTPEAA
jgi:hypothetical protein